MERKVEGRVEVKGRTGRRGKQLLNEVKVKRRYRNLKQEGPVRTLWWIRFGRRYGPVVRQATEWMIYICGSVGNGPHYCCMVFRNHTCENFHRTCLRYRVSINYRRISLRPFTRPDNVWFLPVGFRQGQSLRPATSKDTTRIARAHQHRNRERYTRHAWEGLAGMGVSPGHVPCHTWEAHRMHLRSLWNCKHFSFKW